MVLNVGGAQDVAVLRSGWAARYILFPDGRRQITDIVLPGEFTGCSRFMALNDPIHLVTLSDAVACIFDAKPFFAKISLETESLMTFMEECSVQAIRLRDLLAAMGQQSGAARLAAFLVSLHERLKARGEATEFEMPYYLRQRDLADILGTTQVHISRTMRDLFQAGVLELEGKTARILNPQKLARIAKG